MKIKPLTKRYRFRRWLKRLLGIQSPSARICGFKDIDEMHTYRDDVVYDCLTSGMSKKAECPTCHGTGSIGTTDWLTKDISKKQLAKEKAEAIAEHERYLKEEWAREIFERLHAHRKYDGHTVSVWLNDLICIAKEYGCDLEKRTGEYES